MHCPSERGGLCIIIELALRTNDIDDAQGVEINPLLVETIQR